MLGNKSKYTDTGTVHSAVSDWMANDLRVTASKVLDWMGTVSDDFVWHTPGRMIG